MENTFRVLKIIDENKNITQRDISKSTDISLGNVNLIIKRLIEDGMLKIIKSNPRTVQYVLTPLGQRKRAEITYRIILRSYQFHQEIDLKVNSVLNSFTQSETTFVVLFGLADEISNMLCKRLNEKCIEIKFTHTIDELENVVLKEKSHVQCGSISQPILAWNPDYIEILKERNIGHINLLDVV